MKELILKLASFTAPSGTESDIQEQLLDQVREAADEVWVDTLGNGFARKQGNGPHIMLVAHADEVGAMVIHIEDNGFLRIISVGEVQANTLVGRHLQFTNGVVGIVGAESSVKVEDLTFDDLYVDIGAATAEEASSRIRIGTEGVVAEGVVSIESTKLAGRALDNRVGCAIAIETFKQAASLGYNVSLVFTAQQTVGARGAKTAAYRMKPDLALIVDAVPAGDMPGAKRMEIQLGHGPAIKILDGTFIVPLEVKDHLIKSANHANIPIQYEVWPRGLSDAGAVHTSWTGIPVGGVSYPARYVGGPSTMVDLRDAQAAVQLLVQAIILKNG